MKKIVDLNLKIYTYIYILKAPTELPSEKQYVEKFLTAPMNEFFLAKLRAKALVPSNFSKVCQLFEINSFTPLYYRFY